MHTHARAPTHTQPHAHGAESAECVLSLYFSLPELLGAFFNKKRKKEERKESKEGIVFKSEEQMFQPRALSVHLPLLPLPPSCESSLFTIRFCPSVLRTLIDVCQSVRESGQSGCCGFLPSVDKNVRVKMKKRLSGNGTVDYARCRRRGRGDASRHRSIEQTEH